VLGPEHLTATRAGHDALAEQYGELSRAALDAAPLDRALLGAFAGLVRTDHPGPLVLDVGCGPGTVAGHLTHRLGVPARGLDLSPAMVERARRAHPGIALDVGEMGAIGLADASVAGLVAWYSLIHVPAGRRQGVVHEFARVLRSGGHALLAFRRTSSRCWSAPGPTSPPASCAPPTRPAWRRRSRRVS